jgi:hypothetical protein
MEGNMKAIRLFFLVTSFAICATTAFAQTAKDVTVVNTAAAPVPVKSVDDPARRAFQIGFEVNAATPVSTPAGKIFVVEHVSGSFRLKTVTGSTTPCRFFQLSLPVSGVQGTFESFEIIPTEMGTTSSIGFDVTFHSINHPMKLYLRQNTDLGGMNFLMGGSCAPSPILNSRIVLSGYLVDM